MKKQLKTILLTILIISIIVTTWASTLHWYSQVYDHVVYDGKTYDFLEGYVYWGRSNGELVAMELDPDYSYRYDPETQDLEGNYIPLSDISFNLPLY